jgi:glycerol-3-phosphate dehydrogenase subunit C
LKGNFDTALKVGKPVARQARDSGKTYLASECPLAGLHIGQGMEKIASDKPRPAPSRHPIELFAQAYGVWADGNAKPAA